MPKTIKKLECTIYRDKSGISKKMYPQYDLITSNGKHFLVSAKKMNMVGSAHYVITLDEHEMKRQSSGFLGKVRSNGSGTEYNLFGIGENPSKGLPPEQTRNQLAAVYYVCLYNNIGTNFYK